MLQTRLRRGSRAWRRECADRECVHRHLRSRVRGLSRQPARDHAWTATRDIAQRFPKLRVDADALFIREGVDSFSPATRSVGAKARRAHILSRRQFARRSRASLARRRAQSSNAVRLAVASRDSRSRERRAAARRQAGIARGLARRKALSGNQAMNATRDQVGNLTVANTEWFIRVLLAASVIGAVSIWIARVPIKQCRRSSSRYRARGPVSLDKERRSS